MATGPIQLVISSPPGTPVPVVTDPAPVPVEVLVTWLRKKAAAGVPIRISALLAQRIAAELEGGRHA